MSMLRSALEENERLEERISELESLVESAYREGFSDGYDGDFLSPYVDDEWRCSESKKALEPRQ